MSMSLKVEFDAGSEITDAFQQAIELSNRIQVDIEFVFNGVICFVKPGGNVRRGVAEWQEALASKSQHKFARSY